MWNLGLKQYFFEKLSASLFLPNEGAMESCKKILKKVAGFWLPGSESWEANPFNPGLSKGFTQKSRSKSNSA